MRSGKFQRIFLIVARLFLAAIFIYAAYAKLSESYLSFAATLAGYELLPEDMLVPLARWIPWAELALGVVLLSGIWQRWFGLITSLVLGLFFSVMVRSYAMGLQIDCGCFGAGDPLGPKTLARDGALLAISIAFTILAFRARRRPAISSESPLDATQASGIA